MQHLLAICPWFESRSGVMCIEFEVGDPVVTCSILDFQIDGCCLVP